MIRGAQQKHGRWHGFTLVEMLLVLTLLVVLLAIVWPTLGSLYGDFQLKENAERVRVRLAGARIRAIDAGVTYQFRYQPGGDRYLVLPFESEGLAAESDVARESVAGEPPVLRISGRLEEDLAFQPLPGQPQFQEQLPDEELAGLPDARDLAGLTWSAPILFYPDGTAMDAAFEVVDSRQQTARLSLRGLTGAVSVSRTTSEARQ